jgi:hypothetical protein
MIKDELTNEYFEWLVHLVCDNPCSGRKSWIKLLRCLFKHAFGYVIEMDANRADDGVNLRYRFAYHIGVNRLDVPGTFLNGRPCSVLEMMVALAVRCEEHIMSDPSIGNRIGLWFWGMVDSMGLSSMDDSRFNSYFTGKTINRLLERKYKENGEGGLFYIEDCPRDLRTVEIWYQMMWFLDSIT